MKLINKKLIIYILTIIYIIILIYLYKNKINKNFNIKGYIKLINFSFTNNNKKSINNKIFKKNFIITYFGYTHCPDICPKIINKILENFKFKKNFYKFIFTFISIDYNRDNCEIIQKYLNKFKLNNIYSFTNTNNKIEKLAINYRIIYKNYIKNKKNLKYKINHSNIIYQLNKYQNINFIKYIKL